MNLAIARDLRAGAIEDHGCVVNALPAFGFFKNGTGVDVNLVFFGERSHRAIGWAIRKGFRRHYLGLPVAAKKIETFGQANPVRPFVSDGLFDELGSSADVGGFVADR